MKIYKCRIGRVEDKWGKRIFDIRKGCQFSTMDKKSMREHIKNIHKIRTDLSKNYEAVEYG